MLGRSEIKARNLVGNGVDGSFRAISYDLRVGTVIKPGGEIADHYVLPPQGIVEVVSEERLTVPANVAGIAMVKTGLSNQGLLALNIGIIDPGYEGKIGSFFVNFGKREQVLRKGDVFLRVVFHEVVAPDGDAPKAAPVDDAKYISDKRINMETNFGKEFLDVARVTERFAKEQFEAYRTKILGLVATAAFILAILTFLLNFGNLLLVQRFLQPNDMTRAELLKETLDRNSRDLADQNKALLTQVQQLEQALRTTLGRLDGANRRIDEIDRRTQPPSPPSRSP